MEKKNYIETEDGVVYNISSFKKIIKHNPKVIKDGENIGNFKKVFKGEPLKTFLGFVTKRASSDCYVFRNNECAFIYCQKKKYETFKELFDAIVENYGKYSYSNYGYRFDSAEGLAGTKIAKTKNALYFDDEVNVICTKPYIEFVIDEVHGESVCKVFKTKKEMNDWVEEMI